ncbi:DUF6265 family protein [Pseudochryseolinea flava]|uniref:DUF6265 domain-containing protein n=1 Tax=Pseudochryseolinea flava TaxID=2059302 RepID=A0A364Y3U3_9BACT|nr:DUF6265 family protein [Pseudochryseolinea flava]RAW00858.1 hypothetical protein DQQ10_11480 [Pseudochryseolinea flava]
MKNLIYLCSISWMLLLSVTGIAQHKISDIAWLSGEWSRTNTKPGRSGVEVWSIQGDSILIGKGLTMRGADTVVVENIKIVLRANTLHYVADVNENVRPISFKFIQLQSNGFVCENLDHDFPKRISYTLEKDKLRAVISGDGKSIEYLFVRK